MTGIAIALVAVGALLIWAAFVDYDGSPHQGGPVKIVKDAVKKP